MREKMGARNLKRMNKTREEHENKEDQKMGHYSNKIGNS